MKKIVSYILAATVVLSMVACAKNPDGIKGMQTESTGAGNQQTTSATLSSETVPGGTSGDSVTVPEQSVPQQSESASTLPSQTEPEPSLPDVGTNPGEFGQIYTIDELKKMSTKKTGYGPAMQVLEALKKQLDPNGIMNPYKMGL